MIIQRPIKKGPTLLPPHSTHTPVFLIPFLLLPYTAPPAPAHPPTTAKSLTEGQLTLASRLGTSHCCYYLERPLSFHCLPLTFTSCKTSLSPPAETVTRFALSAAQGLLPDPGPSEWTACSSALVGLLLEQSLPNFGECVAVCVSHPEWLEMG